MPVSRRQFCEGLVIGGALGSGVPAQARGEVVAAQAAPAASAPHLGNMYPFVQG